MNVILETALYRGGYQDYIRSLC